MKSFLDRVQTDDGADWVRRGAWTVLSLALVAFVVRGGSQPADPFVATRAPIAGFGEITFTVTDPAGRAAEWCAMLADTPELRGIGLMDQRHLHGYDGMVFRYDHPTETGFYMKDTVIPLAVAFFDAEGAFVGAHGMDPCPPDVVDCPVYRPAAPFLHAIEVPRGGLGRLGIGPGSSISFPGTPCRT